MSVPERCESGELLCACKKMLTAKTRRETKTVRSRVVFIFSSAPSRAGVEGCPVRLLKIARDADFAGLLAWRVWQLAAFPQRRPFTCTRDLYRVAGTERFAAVASALIFPPYSCAAAT